MEYDTKGRVLKKAVVWKELYFCRKSDAIYQFDGGVLPAFSSCPRRPHR
jgi:hypothetical protein